MTIRFLRRLFPPFAVSREISVEEYRLVLRQGYCVKSAVNSRLMPVWVRNCTTYSVEYSRCPDGEFVGYREKDGRIGGRRRRDPSLRIPVCWLPDSFAGRALARHIAMIDRKRVRIRASVIPSRRAS